MTPVITRGAVQTAKKVVVYGPEGIGKTTFAAQFPRPVFIDTEGSTTHMDVARITPANWGEIVDAVDYFIAHPRELGTLVIDTIDWAEALAFRAVCAERSLKSIEDVPYGKGYVFAKDKVRALLDKLEVLKGMGVNIVLTAHCIVKKFEQPDELGSYDRYALKLNEKQIAPLVKEWADMMLFVNYRTDVVTSPDGKTKKATGGKKRIMYTTHAACWDAKNRFDLPDELPFDFAQIARLFTVDTIAEVAEAAPAPEPEKPRARKKPAAVDRVRVPSMCSDDPEKDAALEQLWKLMQEKRVADPLCLQKAVATKDYYDASVEPRDYDTAFIQDVLIAAWDQVSDIMLSISNDLPF